MHSELISGKKITLCIDKLAFGGQGIGRISGQVVFVNGGLPGQKITALITHVKNRFARARLIDIQEQSPHYTPPKCPHFGECGGCTLQHLDYTQQLYWKTEHIYEQLRHTADLETPVVEQIVPSRPIWHFRNKMEFAFTGGGKSPLIPGLHAQKTEHIIPITQCFVMPQVMQNVLQAAQTFFKNQTLPRAYNHKTHTGLWRFLVLRHSVKTGEVLIHIITTPTTSKKTADIIKALAFFLQKEFSYVTGVVHGVRRAKTNIAKSEKTLVVFGRDLITEQIGDIHYQINAHSFFQTNTHAAQSLYALADKAAALTGSEYLLDLYCGTGGFGLALAHKAKKVIGVEHVVSAICDAKKNAEKNKLRNCCFFCEDVLEFMKKIQKTPQVVLTDPARTGMHPAAIDMLLSCGPQTIIYVSCNPATLARDIKKLLKKYTLSKVWPVDMFPHTGHVECVARLQKNLNRA